MKRINYLLCIMGVVLLTVQMACGVLPKVEFVEGANKIDVMVGGKLFTSYMYLPDPANPPIVKGIRLTKPVLYPIYSPSGVILNRGYPFVKVEGERTDHPHHMGMYFTMDIEEEKFWGNSRNPLPAIKHVRTTKIKDGIGKGTLSTLMHWVGNDGKVLLEENREMVFSVVEGQDQYAIDFTISLKAVTKEVVFVDNKEGMFAVRVAHWLNERGTGRYLSSNAEETEKNIWGKRAKWMRLEGRKGGKKYGIAIMNHPRSVNYPTYWHARGYGCFSANPLGQYIFQKAHKVKNPQPLNLTLKKGESALFKFRMLIYEGPQGKEQLDKEFKNYDTTASVVAPGGKVKKLANGFKFADYQLVYSQSFDEPGALSDFEFADTAKWKFSEQGKSGGALEFLGPGKYKPKVRSPQVLGLLSGELFGDFILEADLFQTGREYGHRDMCLYLNFQNPGEFYYVHIATHADSHAHNIFIVNNQPRAAIAKKTTTGIDWGRNVWHRVRLERDTSAGTIIVYFDDMNNPLMIANDKTFRLGRIGFGSFDDSGKIDNLKIWAPQVAKSKTNFFEKK